MTCRRTGCWALMMVGLLGVPSGVAGAKEAPRGLIVVAPERFHAALDEYLTYRRKERPTELVALEEVLSTRRGVDDPETLKRFLFERWRTRPVGYVLLIGDADVLPVRYMVLDRKTPAAFDYAFYPSDLYYADLAKRDSGAFDDWNARKDGFHGAYFGEVRGEKNKDDPINFDDVDYLPDVAVGRWPVSTEDEVRVVVGKTLAFERSLAERPSHGRRAALVCVGGWVDARGRMDGWARSLEPGWAAEKRYYRGGRRSVDTAPPTAEEVVRLLNDGVGLVLHVGHGRDREWEKSLSTRDLPRLHNAERLAIVASAGCSTARFATLPPYEPYVDVEGQEHRGTDHGEVFDAPPPPPSPYARGRYNPPGLGEALLRDGPAGAVAYIGCNTGGQPCGITLLEGIVDGLRQDNVQRLGDCWSHALAFYHERERLASLEPTDGWYPPSIFFQGMKYMLLGDPTLRLPPPDDGVRETTVHLDIPKRARDSRVGQPLDAVRFKLWIPPRSKALRGVVFNPFYEETVLQEHWRAAVTLWDFALLGANQFGLRPEQLGPTVERALEQLARETERPELAKAPLCYVGMSIGAGLSVRLVEALPGRSIAAGPVCLEVGPRNAPSRRVPMITIFGERDGRQMEILAGRLPSERAEGARWATAVQWGRRHEFARANNLLLPFFDRVIASRLREGAPSGDRPPRLAWLDEVDGWIGDPATWDASSPRVAPFRECPGDRRSACWLPDAYVAAVWRAFVAKGSPIEIVSPPGLGDGEPFRAYPRGALEVTARIGDGADVEELRLFDGDREIGTFSGSPPRVRVERLEPGIHAWIAVGTTPSGRVVVSPPSTIVVSS